MMEIHGKEERKETERTENYGIWIGNVFVERISRQYEYSMVQRHFHSEYEIYYLIKGDRYYFIDQKIYAVPSGTLVFVDKGQIHKTSMGREPAHERILIQLKDDRISGLLEGTEEGNLDGFFGRNSGALTLEGENRKYVESILRRSQGKAVWGRRNGSDFGGGTASVRIQNPSEKGRKASAGGREASAPQQSAGGGRVYYCPYPGTHVPGVFGREVFCQQILSLQDF